jgi:hypothetical protein
MVVDDFESGAITGWQAVGGGSGGWFVYADGHKPPDPAQSDPNAPFDVPDPPQGRFAAVTDMNGPGTRILYRDLRLEGRFSLQLSVFYTGTAPFSSPATLAHDTPEPNQQFRIDLLSPSAPIDSVAKGDVLVNVFGTSPDDPARRQPTEVRMDVSAWAGQTGLGMAWAALLAHVLEPGSIWTRSHAHCWSRPRRWATAAASPRPATPSLARMWETWRLAVFSVMNSA